MEKEESPSQCPNTVTVRRNPHRKARPTPATTTKATDFNPSSAVSSFPLQEILAIEIPPNPKHNSSSSSTQAPLSENLKVYLRIRPTLQLKDLKKSGNNGDRILKSGPKNVWPQNPEKKRTAREKSVKKKSREDCITVNDSHSVTVFPPSAFQETRRSKSEVYEGFSHVFSTQSSQDEVYGRMVGPLVDDFLKGKSGMLTALGPSGSGKTHTIFGCPRDPGMVPLALRHIFSKSESSDSRCSRSYHLSVFEIYSEKGKGEKIYDLSADGAELSMQQFNIKGLKEVPISNAREAESLVACAFTKRATAMTNSNSKSSRSQCIINIRRAGNQDEVDDASNCAILTIVDLAGAEREKRTGNQGTRLLEANFINNTSMVFGLCLRSLFEHQRNPKKPMQKHFLSSLLTKYLRDYLEGKKRMTLILTVKAGEEDYLDTSHLLRQASPYMKIKFNNAVEPSNTFSNKRQLQTLYTFEEPKRTKYSVLEACVREGKGHQEEGIHPQEDITKCPPGKSSTPELAGKERNHLITQNFAKAMWNVLKQYRDKLKIAETEIQDLREEMKNERMRYFELEKQWQNSRCCACSKEELVDAASFKVETSFEFKNDLNENKFNIHEEAEGNRTPKRHDSSPCEDMNVKEAEGNGTPKRHGSSPREDMNSGSEPNVVVEAHINHSDKNTPRDECSMVNKSRNLEIDDGCPIADLTELGFGSFQSRILEKNDSCSSVELDEQLTEEDEGSKSSAESPLEDASSTHCGARDCENELVLRTSLIQSTSEKSNREVGALNEDQKPLTDLLDSQQLPPTEEIASSQERKIDVHYSEPRAEISSNLEKPKRRLLPASSTLLRDFSNMHVEDDIEVPKVNRSGKKSAMDGKNRTQGSISLLRMLKSNIRTQ